MVICVYPVFVSPHQSSSKKTSSFSLEMQLATIMKPVSEVEEKPSTSSLNIWPERDGEGLSNDSPFTKFYFPAAWPVDISFKDDVTIILLHGDFPSCKAVTSSILLAQVANPPPPPPPNFLNFHPEFSHQKKRGKVKQKKRGKFCGGFRYADSSLL